VRTTTCLILGAAALLWSSDPRAEPKKGDELQLPPIRLEKGVFVTSCEASRQELTLATFPADTMCVKVWVQLAHVYKEHLFRFMYYDPDGNLNLATKGDWSFQPAEPKNGYHHYAWIEHRLPIRGEQAAILPGAWRVDVMLDNLHLAEGSFRLEERTRPEDPRIAEGRALYMNLLYEKAAAKLAEAIRTEMRREYLAEAHWWLALAQASLGRAAEAHESLVELLRYDPTYAVTPEAAKEAGGTALRSALEEIRNGSFPDLYKKTSYPPEIELSKPEAKPILQRRWPLWKKLLVYGGIPVVAAGATAFFASRGDETPEPLNLDLNVERDAKRGTDHNYLCAGPIPLSLNIIGGRKPYEALFTVTFAGGFVSQQVQVGSLATLQVGDEVVMIRQQFPNNGTLRISSPPVTNLGTFEAFLRIGVLVKDAGSAASFDGAVLGKSLPASLRNLPQTDPSVRDAFFFDAVLRSGAGCPR
jgi:tetratricopeptide (TPR) repeat protein